MAVAVETCASEVQILEISRYFSILAKRSAGIAPDASASAPADVAAAPGDAVDLFDRCTQLVEAHQQADAVSALIDALPVLFSEALDREVEGCMNVIYSLAVKLSGNQVDLASKLRDAVASKPSEKPYLRLQILSRMFNSNPPQSPARLALLQAMLKFACDAGIPSVVTPSFSQLDTWLGEWNASAKQRRELYETAADVLKAAGRSEELYLILLKYLATYESAADEELATAALFASRAVALAIGLPEVFQMGELLALKAVQKLRGGPAWELLEVFTRGRLSDLRSFVERHPDALAALGVDAAAAEHKIRLLGLVSACAAAPAGDVQLSAISAEIDVPEAEAERWVVEAITRQLLTAKIDQQARRVHVSYTQHRVFEAAQWGQLEAKLTAWRQVVAGVVSVLQQNAIRARDAKPAGRAAK
eukprot:m51a1_g7176 putative proteasome component region pci domain-containing protein (419) ;mRNA; r:72755-74310